MLRPVALSRFPVGSSASNRGGSFERARAIAEGRAREAVVRLTDLRPGQRLWLVSSLRGVREARLVG